MKTKKLILLILAIIPFGIFAQEVATEPVSQDEIQLVSQQVQQVQAKMQSNDLIHQDLKVSEGRALNTTFFKNRFRDNWFISLGGGLGYLAAEEHEYTSYFESAQPVATFAVGKWISPTVGFRFSAAGGKLQGFNVWYEESATNGAWGHGDWYVGANPRYEDPFMTELQRSSTNAYVNSATGSVHFRDNPAFAIETGRFIQETFLSDNIRQVKGGLSGRDYFLTYASASIDMLVNVNNLFTQYNPKRFFNLVAFGGFGYAHTFRESNMVNDLSHPGQLIRREKTAVNSVMAKGGLEASFRLSEQMTFNIEPHILVVPEIFDRMAGNTRTQDVVINTTVGFTYKFKTRHFYEPACPATPVLVQKPRTECCEDLVAQLKRIGDILERMQVPAPAQPAVVPTEIEKERLKVVVHFVIDRWEVRQSEMYKLDEVARFMNKYPQVRVTVAGYADVQTAYPAYNKRLSERRANEVARILTTKYGIDRDRLNVTFYGDTVQPFDVNELNRAVIIFDIPK